MTIHPDFANLNRTWGTNIIPKTIHVIPKMSTVESKKVSSHELATLTDEIDMMFLRYLPCHSTHGDLTSTQHPFFRTAKVTCIEPPKVRKE